MKRSNQDRSEKTNNHPASPSPFSTFFREPNGKGSLAAPHRSVNTLEIWVWKKFDPARNQTHSLVAVISGPKKLLPTRLQKYNWYTSREVTWYPDYTLELSKFRLLFFFCFLFFGCWDFPYILGFIISGISRQGVKTACSGLPGSIIINT